MVAILVGNVLGSRLAYLVLGVPDYIGMVMRQKLCHSLAPSILAASSIRSRTKHSRRLIFILPQKALDYTGAGALTQRRPMEWP